jgi:hypothetical protein
MHQIALGIAHPRAMRTIQVNHRTPLRPETRDPSHPAESAAIEAREEITRDA